MKNRIGKLAVRCHNAAENRVMNTQSPSRDNLSRVLSRRVTLARLVAKRILRIVHFLCWNLAGDAMQRDVSDRLYIFLAKCKEYLDEEAIV